MDLRVPVGSILGAFGLRVTVTTPNDLPVATTGVWLSPLEEPQPVGIDFRRGSRRRLLAIPRTATLDAVPRGTAIVASEYLGGPALTWLVDGLDRVEADLIRVIVVPAKD